VKEPLKILKRKEQSPASPVYVGFEQDLQHEICCTHSFDALLANCCKQRGVCLYVYANIHHLALLCLPMQQCRAVADG
jgi:hypothetical protein